MKILCFGSLNLDYVYEVDHMVRPGETTTASSYNIFEGGKGQNQAIALGRAGACCFMAGMIGSDGTNILNSLKQSNVNADLVLVNEGKTGHTVIQVDKSGQNSILYFPGTNQMITEAYVEQVISRFEPGDFIIMQNEINNIPFIMENAKHRGLKIVFNPSPITEGLSKYPLQLVDLLVLNELEGLELTNESEPQAILEKLHDTYPETAVLLTLGKKGAIYSDGKKQYSHGIYDVKVVDTTAAGDTFTGYFLAGLANNETIENCLQLASIASSITVSRPGASASIPTMSEVKGCSLSKKV